MNIGNKIIYNGIEYTIILIEENTIHLENDNVGICVLKNEIEIQ